MKKRIKINLATDHDLECAEKIIGRAGEGLVSSLEITVPNALTDYNVYIDFEKPNGETLRTPKLEVANGVAYYDVPQYLLCECGEIKAQLVLVKGQGVWKSSKKRFTILKSINATDDIPEKEDFFTEAQRILDEFSQEAEGIAEILKDDKVFAQTIIEACGDIAKINTINGLPLKFFVGTQAVYDELSDTQKQNLFAIITDDRTKEELFNAISSTNEELTNLKSTSYNLSCLKEGDARFIDSTFDIDTLCLPSNCGVYVLHYMAVGKGQINGLPDDVNIISVNGAKLIVEADYDATDSNYSIYQTLKICANDESNDLSIYHRAYHKLYNRWGTWKKFISADEAKPLQSNSPIIDTDNKTIDFPIGSLLTVADNSTDNLTGRLGAGDILTTSANDRYLSINTTNDNSKIASDYAFIGTKSNYDNELYTVVGDWVICGRTGLQAVDDAYYYYLIRRVA